MPPTSPRWVGRCSSPRATASTVASSGRSDGTAAGTALVKDVNPGAEQGQPTLPTAVGDTLFFTADDGTHGRELWTSDGTEAGTVMVKDIDSDDAGYYSGPTSMAEAGGTLFFTVDDGVHGRELWKSDGTEAGTVLVKDIRPGGYGSNPVELTEVGDALFFGAQDGVHGRELWTSDGTEAGTVLVKDIDDDIDYYSGPQTLTAVGDLLFFSADDGVHGRELWTSDGTAAGTALVEDINLVIGFRVSSRGRPDTSNGTLRVSVSTDGPGRLAVAPAAGSKLKRSARDLADAESTTVLLRPTRAGLRELRRTGELRVKARFTFTPCGGPASSVVRTYTLKLR